MRLRFGVVAAILLGMALTGCGGLGIVSSSITAPCRAAHYSELIWSPDGQHIAFQESQGKASALFVMNADGTGVQRLAGNFAWYGGLHWLADSQSLAFQDGQTVVTIGLDRTSYVSRIPATDFAAIVFSPDASTVIVERYKDPHWSTAELDSTTGDFDSPLPLPLDRLDNDVTWSPDGTHLAYTRTEVDDQFIYVANANGSGQRLLTKGEPPILWSPDSQWISFNNSESGVHIISVDGKTEKLITANAWGSQHVWLPDSTHISFVSDAPLFSLTVIDIFSLTEESLTTDRINPKVYLAWSPDGSQVAYLDLVATTSNLAGLVEEISVINRDGTDLKRLTDNPGRYQCFKWPF